MFKTTYLHQCVCNALYSHDTPFYKSEVTEDESSDSESSIEGAE